MLENFIYAKQKSLFERALNNGQVLDEAIVFIEDTKEIWNHGTYFYGHRMLSFNNIPVNTWTVIEDINFPYNYFSNIDLNDITENDYAEISFDISCAISGDYAPICETYNGGVKIYSKKADPITIPTIIIHKNYQII